MRIPEVTDHVESILELLERFGFELSTSRDGGMVVVAADPS